MNQNDISQIQREKMIVLLCNEYGLSHVGVYSYLPENLKSLFIHMSYRCIVTPLIRKAKAEGATYDGMEEKFCMSRATISRILKPNSHEKKKVY